MNKLSVSIIALISLCFQAFSQSKFTWEKTYGGLWYEIGYSVDQTFDGGLVIAGFSWSDDGDVKGHHGSVGEPDAWILKLDASGDTVWTRSLGGTRAEYANRIIETPDSGFIIAAQAESIDGDVWDHHGAIWYDDAWIVKLDKTGDTVWTKSYGGTDDDYAYSIDLTNDGGYIIGSTSYSSDGDVWDHIGSWDYWIVRINSIGDTLWTRSFGGTSGDYLEAIKTTDDGGCIAAGWTWSTDSDVVGNHGGKDAWVIKLDSAGTLQWQKVLGGSWWDYAFSLDLTSDGNYIVAGASESQDGDVWGNNGWYDFWVVKLNTAGDTLWTRSYGGTKDDVARSIKNTCDNGYVLTGYSNSNDGNVSGHHGSTDSLDAWVLKIDSNGVVEWQVSLGGTRPDMFYNINETNDGYLLATGYSISVDGDVSVNKGLNDLWVVKMKANKVNQEICMVSVDSTSTKNVVVWEKPLTAGIDSFRIYREFGINNYVHIGSVAYTALSKFTDTTGGVNPMVQSYRYKLSVIDSCGNESDMSAHHRTIHLATPQLTPPSTFDLIWTNDYEGFLIPGYNILRDGNNTGTWDSIAFVTYGNLSYTDINAPSNNARYIVEAAHPTGCTASKKAEDYNSSRSNTSISVTGIKDEFGSGNLEFRVYPNPSNGVFTVVPYDGSDYNLRIYDVLGREIFALKSPKGDFYSNSPLGAGPSPAEGLLPAGGGIEIDLSGQPAGMYHLQIITDKGIGNKKIIIE